MHPDVSRFEGAMAKWFAPFTLRNIAGLWEVIRVAVRSTEHLRFFQVCLSHTLRACCSQDRHWGWIADNVTPKKYREHDASAAFLRHTEAMLEEIGRMYQELDASELSSMDVLRRSQALLADCRQPLGVAMVDAVVTSPPYPCVIDYTRSQRLTYELFGWDRKASEDVEIGARWKRFRKRQFDEYIQDLAAAFANINAVLRPGGMVGLVIDAVARPRRDLPLPPSLDVAETLHRTFGYEMVGEAQVRQLSSQRFLDRRGSCNREFVMVLQKPS
jgi:hypothetical protein